ncbi:hypothetical protein AB0442_29180 [Kitasatospora sp. NPDC085895]|uniref:hypothetical protein n=1 Tax=Kitasatospora sp. NPDC085895 TaxID=3155057 RepID=UPI00344DFF9F
MAVGGVCHAEDPGRRRKGAAWARAAAQGLSRPPCPLDATDHLEIGYDPIALTDVLNALDPAHPRPIPCQVVLPVTGPLL